MNVFESAVVKEYDLEFRREYLKQNYDIDVEVF